VARVPLVVVADVEDGDLALGLRLFFGVFVFGLGFLVLVLARAFFFSFGRVSETKEAQGRGMQRRSLTTFRVQ
jgi:hypothetical protein